MRKLLMSMIFIAFGTLYANDVLIYSAENKDGKITPQTIEDEFKKAGFYISDNRDMNIPFMRQFKKTDFEVYNLFTSYHIESVHNLAKEYPRIGLFTPMSMAIYTKKGDSKIHISFLTSDAIARISEIPADNKDLKKIGELVKSIVSKALPNGSYEKVEYQVSTTQKELITKMHIKLDPEEWEDTIEGIIEEFEGELELNGFVQAGYSDVNYDFKKKGDDTYDLFITESICKLPVIYSVAKTRPEAGAFAPCSISIYKKKGENFMYLEYPNVYNWIASLTIKDKEALEQLILAQAKMEVSLNTIKADNE